MVILIYPLAVQWDILGVSLAVFFSILIPTSAFSVHTIKITQCAFKDYSKRIVFPLFGACIMVIVISVLRPILGQIGILEFSFLGGVGLLSYILTIYIWERFFDFGITPLLRRIFTSV